MLFPNAKRTNLKVSVSPISDLWNRFRMSLGHEFIGKKKQGYQETLGGTPTIPTTAKRSYDHMAIHHHNDKYNVNSSENKIQFWLHTHKKIVSSPLSNRSAILCHQLSRILFFNNLFQQNYLSLLRTSRCGILLNQRITAFQRNYSFCLFPHWFLTEGSPCQNPRTNPCFPLSGNDPQIVDLEF